jgi:serine/threonine protein kinase
MTTSDPFRTLSVELTEGPLGERFRKLRPLARGGLGEVYVARDEQLDREVALKQMLPQLAEKATARQRFVREAEITGGLEHPGIVPVYGLGTCKDGRPYYAMRLIRGETLKDAVVRFHDPDGQPRTPGERSVVLRRLLSQFLEVCQAIEYAHSRRVLHRDLKPSNIMLGKYGETLVVDWGLAKAAGHDDVPPGSDDGVPPGSEFDEPVLMPRSGSGSEPTAMGKAIGTPSYMSPEQAAGRVDLVGVAADVYGLGATLYEILTGRPPIAAGTIGEMLQRVEAGKILRPRQVQPDVPAGLEAICLKAIARDPDERYASAAALATDIEHWLADEPIVAQVDSFTQRVDRWLRRNRTIARAAALTVFLLAVCASIALAIVHGARVDAEEAHAQEIQQRNLARQAVDRYEEAVQRLKHLAAHPELALLRDSAEYKDLLQHLEHSQATIPDGEGRR